MELLGLKKSMRRFILLGLLGGTLTLGSIAAWASLTEIQGAVIAPGKLVVETSSKRIQHAEGGIIKSIDVKNGDYVEAGKTLVSLDETERLAEQAILETVRMELLAKIGRLEAERDGSEEIVFDDEMTRRKSEDRVANLIRSQTRLFKTQRSSIESRRSQLGKRIGQSEREIGGISAQVEAVKIQSHFIEEELADGRSLLKSGLTQRPRVLALERESAKLKGQHGQLIAQIARTEGQIAEIELQRIQLSDDVRTRAITELREAEAKLQEHQERLGALSARLFRTDIKAPRNGYVQQLNVHTIGGVISPGETIMLIVPEEDALVIEARVRPQDIDQIYRNQAASLRFTNADSRLTPQIHGTIEQISADLQQDNTETAPYYLVRLKVDPDEMQSLDGLSLKAGMPVDAFIQTTPRSPASYLLRPFSDQLNRAFREK